MTSDFAAGHAAGYAPHTCLECRRCDANVIQSAHFRGPGCPKPEFPESASSPSRAQPEGLFLRLVQSDTATPGTGTQPHSQPAPGDSTQSIAGVDVALGLQDACGGRSARCCEACGTAGCRSALSVQTQVPTGLLPTGQPPPPVPDGARFLSRSFTGAAGTRTYKLYIPASAPDQPLGLIVMLHGCKQDPDDFAAGTNMNAIAEGAWPCCCVSDAKQPLPMQHHAGIGLIPPDQRRDAGEPSIIAGLSREIVSELNIDRPARFSWPAFLREEPWRP